MDTHPYWPLVAGVYAVGAADMAADAATPWDYVAAGAGFVASSPSAVSAVAVAATATMAEMSPGEVRSQWGMSVVVNPFSSQLVQQRPYEQLIMLPYTRYKP